MHKDRFSLNNFIALFFSIVEYCKRGCLQKDNSVFDILPRKYFHLTENVVCCVKEFKGYVCVDIRRYKLLEKRLPTKEGIVINPLTWYSCEKIHGFNFLYKDSSFIVNNCLLGLNIDDLHLQQNECKSNESIIVKAPFITLTLYEVLLYELLESEDAITTSVIQLLWVNLLPRKLLHAHQKVSPPVCDNKE